MQNNEQRVYIYDKYWSLITIAQKKTNYINSRNAKVDSFNVAVYGPRTLWYFLKKPFILINIRNGSYAF